MHDIDVVVGLGFGSEGKGAIVKHVADIKNPKTAVCAFTPNTGHTAYHKGEKYVFCLVPLASMVESVDVVMIGPGAVLKISLFMEEVAQVRKLYPNKRIVVHSRAAYVTAEDLEAEKELVRIGSTMKGTAAANIRKLKRQEWSTVGQLEGCEPLPELDLSGIEILEPSDYKALLEERIQAGGIIVEGTQGYSLSINHGFFPYTTSRDCTASAVLQDCGFSLMSRERINVIGVTRTFPIRVANRFDSDGNQIGTSGPCYDDQEETTFEAIGVPTEYTTVTKLPRRVFTFSNQQFLESVSANSCDEIAFTFLDYLSEDDQTQFLAEMGFMLTESVLDNRSGVGFQTPQIKYGGYGPNDMRTFGPKKELASCQNNS